MVHTLSILASGARQSRLHPHTHIPEGDPQFGQMLLPDRALVPCPGPRATVSASRRPPVGPVSLPPVAPSPSGWLAPTSALSPKSSGLQPHGGVITLFSLSPGHSASMGPRWTRQVGRGHPDRAPDPQIGGPGPRTKGRGRRGEGGCASLEKGGVGWLERNVIYGVTVARGQTHPGHPTRYMAFWPESGLSLCAHPNVRVVCSLVHCK